MTSQKPDRYREKTCPTCGTVHKKRGPYCSRSCGNARSFTYAERKNLSDKMTQYMTSAEGAENSVAVKDHSVVARIKAKNKHDPDAAELSLEDFFLEPVVRELPDNQFVQDGDLWTET